MGILRTDKISGLETPTAVTGSVSFDGNDNLSIGSAGDFNFLHNARSDWTAEFWVKTGSATRQFVFGNGASSAQVGFSITVMSTDDNQSDGTGVYAQFGRGSSGNYSNSVNSRDFWPLSCEFDTIFNLKRAPGRHSWVILGRQICF